MVEAAVANNLLKGVRISPLAPIISQLCFADDTIIFSQATVEEAGILRGIIDSHAAASGQIINMEKSTMVFSPNASTDLITSIQAILPFQVVEKFDKYLGLPARIGRSKTEVFSYLKERIWSRVQGWNEKHISMAGRETLIKAVLQSIPTYVMSCFKLPQSILEEVEKIIRRYWWGSKHSRGVSWLSWSQLCKPKSQGGLGFRDMECFNIALLTKQAWRIHTCPDLLLRKVFKARYFPTSSFLVADLGDRPSWTWRSILSSRPYLESGLRRRIGNGLTTSIWGDSWLLSEGSGRVITTRSASDPFPNTVSDLIDDVTGDWCREILEAYLWQCDIQQIVKIPLGPSEVEDSTYWSFSKDGRFTVRSCYHNILAQSSIPDASSSGHSLQLDSKEWKWLWGLQLPPKIRIFIWRACNDIIPVNCVLTRRHITGNPFCPVCGTDLESTIHPFFECSSFYSVWEKEPFKLDAKQSHPNFVEWLRFLRSRLEVKEFMLACVICWRIWWVRNRIVHNELQVLGEDIVEGATNFLEAYLTAQNPKVLKEVSAATCWQKPVHPFIKINFDVGIMEGNSYQVAMVARDFEGRCLWWRVRRLTGCPPSSIGEARAALESDKLAQEKGWHSITLEGDNSSIISAIQNRLIDLQLSFGSLVAQVISLSSYFNSFKCIFVGRSCNKLAHELAHISFPLTNMMEALDLPANLANVI